MKTHFTEWKISGRDTVTTAQWGVWHHYPIVMKTDTFIPGTDQYVHVCVARCTDLQYATLISAAPDLLGVCQDILSLCESKNIPLSKEGLANSLRNVIEKATF